MSSIYGKYEATLPIVMDMIAGKLQTYNEEVRLREGDGVYEHLNYRIKSEESMREKCRRRGIDETPESALLEPTDSIGLRIATRFIDDIYTIVEFIRSLPGCEIVQEKDYIRSAKPNGYRSYHMILAVTVPYEDVRGNNPGTYFVEIQLRTIAMDSWASLEHQLKYKQDIANAKMITAELKRCADELAACDVSMQTLRRLIRDNE